MDYIFESKRKIVNFMIIIFFLFNLFNFIASESDYELNKYAKTFNDNEERPFYMGFSMFPYAYTKEAIENTTKFINVNADAVVLPVDKGVPWEEAYKGVEFPKEVNEQIDSMVKILPKSNKVILSISPVNEEKDDLTGDWNLAGKEFRVGEFIKVGFNDKKVIKAYSNYCIKMIEKVKPSYLVYFPNINMILNTNPLLWNDIKVFCKEVYANIKKAHPEIPVMFSIQLDEYNRYRSEHEKSLKEIINYTDVITVEAYPFAFTHYSEPDSIPTDYFSNVRSLAKDKKFAILETGYVAEKVKNTTIEFSGDENKQFRYLEILLNNAYKNEAEFVCWSISRDYDELWETIEKKGSDFWFLTWKDTGLYDGNGKERKAFKLWKAVLKKGKSN